MSSGSDENQKGGEITSATSGWNNTYPGGLQRSTIWLALGSNKRGPWGGPAQALERVKTELSRAGLQIVAGSRQYRTEPYGIGRQSAFQNAVIGVRGSIAPASLLRTIKRIERSAGRRSAERWTSRELDIDILDYRGSILGHPARRTQRGTLIVPHPEMTRRGFVLVPLAAIAPGWRHPLLGIGARALLIRDPSLSRGVRLDRA